MASFIVVETQNNGCDYTIACGTRVSSIKAIDIKDAQAQYRNTLLSNYGDIGDFPGNRIEIDSVEIYEMSNHASVNLDTIKKEMTDAFNIKELEREEKRLETKMKILKAKKETLK